MWCVKIWHPRPTRDSSDGPSRRNSPGCWLTWRPRCGPAYPSAHSCLLHFPWCWSQERTLINCLRAHLYLSISHWSGTCLDSMQQREIITSANGVNSAGQEATLPSESSDTEYKVHRAKGRESGSPALEKLLVQWAPRQDKLGEVQSKCNAPSRAAPCGVQHHQHQLGMGSNTHARASPRPTQSETLRVLIKPSR